MGGYKHNLPEKNKIDLTRTRHVCYPFKIKGLMSFWGEWRKGE
jgi:hypothetical protein